MSLQTRINSIIALSMLLIVVLGIVFTVYNARKTVHETITAAMELTIQSVKAGISESDAIKDPARFWQTRMGFSASTQNLRVRIILPNGRAIDYIGAWAMRNVHPVPNWYVKLFHPELFVRNELIDSAIGPARVAIRANPSDEIAKSWKSAEALFGLIFLQALLVGVLAHFTLNHALRSVPAILQGLKNIKEGKYDIRLPDSKVPEFSKISEALNHTSHALELALDENRALASRTLKVQEEERQALARELHDELGQSLTGIKMTASSIVKEAPATESAAHSIINICDHLFSVVRSMMRRLRPTMLDELGLVASLQDMIEHWREQHPETVIRMDLHAAADECDETVQIHLFRIVQEALNNVARHSQATGITIHLTVKQYDESTSGERFVRLVVEDNGRGFDVDEVRAGFGLLGIRERAESLRGWCTFNSSPGHGVIIKVQIPIGG